jgi:hypothetical protein
MPPPALSVRRYERSDQPAWDELVAGSRTPHFLFLRGYMEHQLGRLTDCSLLVEDGHRLIACVPANREGDVVVSHAGLTFGGVITRSTTGLRRMADVFAAVIGHLRDSGCTSWVYKPVPHIYHLAPAEEDLYALARHGAQLTGRDAAAVIAMGRREAYDRGRRGSVNRSRRHGLAVSRETDVRPYVALLEDVLASTHDASPVHTADELQHLADRFPDGIKLYTARHEGRLLGGIVVYETAMVARTQYIGAGEDGKELGAIDAILDRLLNHEYRDKPFVDLGTSSRPATGELNEGLARNKESYGARTVAFDRYTVPLA